MIRVRLFASLREAAGQSEIELPCKEEPTARQVFDELVKLFPALERLGPVALVAVNEAYGHWDAAVSPGDEVAFFPPVSGGNDDCSGRQTY